MGQRPGAAAVEAGQGGSVRLGLGGLVLSDNPVKDTAAVLMPFTP